MGGRFALPQLLVSRVQRVIHLVDFQNFVPAQKSQGMKQLMAGGGVALIGITLVPLLSGLFG